MIKRLKTTKKYYIAKLQYSNNKQLALKIKEELKNHKLNSFFILKKIEKEENNKHNTTMKWINKLLDVPKLIRRLWVILWIVEILLIVMKFCFNIWYPIIIENENIIKISNFVDNSRFLQILFQLIFYIINFNLVYLIATKRKFYSKIYEPLVLNILIIANFFIKDYSNSLGLILEFVLLILLPIIKNKKVLFPIIINVLIMLWQLNMLFIRGIDDLLKEMPFILSLTLQLDYYIFLIITWIGVNFYMSTWGVWFWSEKVTKYEAKKEAELKKAEPDMEYVEYLDEKIAECKKHIEKKEEE